MKLGKSLAQIAVISSFCFSASAHQVHSEKLSEAAVERIKYANIYADLLIEDFDKRLDAPIELENSIFETETYARIQAARQYIEHSGGEATKYSEKNMLLARDSKILSEVVDAINSNAEKIQIQIERVNTKDRNANVLYPSITSAGNITGNTFPRNVWSLTYDDGPRGSRTKSIVDNLYLNGFEATFFMLTREAKRYKTTVDYVLDNNMELALHSYTHKNLNKASAATMDYEITTAKKELETIGNRSISLFRLPYGAGLRNGALRKKIADQKMIHVFWNVDTLDWKDKDPQSIYNRTVKQMAKTRNKSGVILFHDIHKQTVTASEMVVDYMKANFKKVCTVGEVVKYHNSQPQSCL